VKTIHKYRVPLTGSPERFELPVGAKVIHVEKQDDVPMMWIEFDQDKKITESLQVEVFGTGWDIPKSYTHAGTFQDGRYVRHVYYRSRV
jgi:hypothetical protein